ncbi:AAA family ATPase [Bacillus sp. FSL W7-1360]
MFEVHTARREKQKAVVGLIGPSGAGKTVGALMIAKGMMQAAYPDADDSTLWSKIGVADTEHKRSMLYANVDFGNDNKIGEFLHINFDPPYSTDRYQAAVEALKQAGAEVVVIDSLSHNWQGEGGIVDQHAGMSGNSFQNWGKLSSETTKLVKTLTRNNVHIIATLRTKQEYAVETNDHGRMQPVKIGTKPVQKDEMEYEFMLNFSLDMSNKAVATKDNTLLFKDQEIKLTPDIGKNLYNWLELGADVKAEEDRERQHLLDDIKIAIANDAEKKKLVEQFEFKTGMKIEDFDYKYTKAAHEKLKLN